MPGDGLIFSGTKSCSNASPPHAKLATSTTGKKGRAVQYSVVAGNPFAVLTAVVAPAILTNASSVLALGTSNRLARVVDRTRLVAAELAAFEPGSEGYRIYSAQLEPLQVRAQMLLKALRLFYAGLGLF